MNIEDDDSMLPRPIDQESLAEILEAFEAALTAIQETGAGPDILVDICRMFVIAAAGWHESQGEAMPPSKHAVRTVLGMVTGLLRANKDM